jgi:integrase
MSSLLAAATISAAAKCQDVKELVGEYIQAYRGRDPALASRLQAWVAKIGDIPLATLLDDHVFTGLDRLAAEPARRFMGLDADGKPIYRAYGKRSSATLGRYHAALSAVFSWGIRRRRTPRGFENVCRRVARPPESPHVVRFLSPDERTRLLAACRASSWQRLYLSVLIALTTGARRGELTALRWSDVDLERAVAFVRVTKNGEPRVLPLLPAVLEELARFRAEDVARFKVALPSTLIFHSERRPQVAFHFEALWQRAVKMARIKNFTFHCLRHTTASYLAQEGASLLEIADVLGHRQLQMVRRYAHLTTKSKSALLARILGGIR